MQNYSQSSDQLTVSGDELLGHPIGTLIRYRQLTGVLASRDGRAGVIRLTGTYYLTGIKAGHSFTAGEEVYWDGAALQQAAIANEDPSPNNTFLGFATRPSDAMGVEVLLVRQKRALFYERIIEAVFVATEGDERFSPDYLVLPNFENNRNYILSVKPSQFAVGAVEGFGANTLKLRADEVADPVGRFFMMIFGQGNETLVFSKRTQTRGQFFRVVGPGGVENLSIRFFTRRYPELASYRFLVTIWSV